MRNYRKKIKRNKFRNNAERSFYKNGNGQKFGSDFSTNTNFKRNNLGRNNQNAPKLVEKYTNLAKEALSNGDKILYENYLQHADHFIRILGDKENFINNAQNDNEQINKNTSSENSEEISESNVSVIV
jgi:hypothetical protein